MAYNRYLLLPVLCPRGWRSWSVLARCGSRGRWVSGLDVSLGSAMWRTGCCPCSMPPTPPPPTPTPLSTSVMDPKEQQGHYSLAPATWQELPEWGLIQRHTALATPTQDFPSRLTPQAFPKEGKCKATVIIARWPPLSLLNRRPLTDLVLGVIWVSSQPPQIFPCENCWGCPFSRRRLDPGAGSTGLEVTSFR